jgi:multiple sugar transport system substrate-binding protein
VARWFTILNLRLNGADFHEALMRGEASYEDERIRAVFEQWAEMLAHNCFPDNQLIGYGVAANQIHDGDAAMYNLGEWLVESYDDGFPDTFDFFNFPVLNPDVPQG